MRLSLLFVLTVLTSVAHCVEYFLLTDPDTLVRTSLRGASASATAGDQSSVTVQGNDNFRRRRIGGKSLLESSGAVSGPSSAGTSLGMATMTGGPDSQRVILTSAGADAGQSNSVTNLGDSRVSGSVPVSKTSSGGSAFGLATRVRRAVLVVGREGSAASSTKDAESVLTLGSTTGDASDSTKILTTGLTAGSTGVRAGRVATAVSLASAMNMGGSGRSVSTSALNAGSTAADANGRTATLTLGNTGVRTVTS